MSGTSHSFFVTGLRALEDGLRESAREARAAGLTEADWITVMVSEPEDFRPEALHALRLIAQATWRGHDVC
jgi:hypothetical protein